MEAHLHEDLEVFGSGMGEEDKTWNAVIRQALIAGYLTKEVENYGLLKVTDAGKKFLKHPKSFKITEDNDFEEVEEEAPARGGGACAVDPALYSMLKDLRKKLSKKLEVPPYVIFQDPSLEAMATIYPITLDELQNIPGVGAGKAKRYGEEFCKLIKRHCEENEIERPEDLRVRTVANKSKMKVAIIQAIDRKVALDDIAMSKGIEFEELLDEIEAIVYSGTKLNIDYFLEDIMDEDHLLDIYDYFKESTTDNIDDALDELGDDFTEEELKSCISKAYDSKFDNEEIAPLVKAGDTYYLELFHGATIAFKDMALSILPHLMTTAAKKNHADKEIVILTATYGDNGKAAMAGFADVEGTRIIVFYPKDGVSQVQELQMVTQKGENVDVVAIHGNFDQAQSGVK